MHVLHKILVYKEEGFDVTELEQERIDEARSLAEYDTEKYFEEVMIGEKPKRQVRGRMNTLNKCILHRMISIGLSTK